MTSLQYVTKLGPPVANIMQQLTQQMACPVSQIKLIMWFNYKLIMWLIKVGKGSTSVYVPMAMNQMLKE